MKKIYRPLPDDLGRITKLVIVYNAADTDGKLSKEDKENVLNYFRGIINAFKSHRQNVEIFIVVDDNTEISIKSQRALTKDQADELISSVPIPDNISICYVLYDKHEAMSAAAHNAGIIPDQRIQDYIHPLEFINSKNIKQKDILLLYTAVPPLNAGGFGASYVYTMTVNARLAKYDNIYTMSAPLIIEGGNTLFFRDGERDIMLTGSTNISMNNNKIMPSPLLNKVHPQQDDIVLQTMKSAFGVENIDIIENFDYKKVAASKKWLQHIDMFITLAGKDNSGRQILLVGEMNDKYTTLLQGEAQCFKEWPQLLIKQKDYLNNLYKRLRKKYTVIRVPMPVIYDVVTPNNSYILSYNNSLVEIYKNTRKITLPSYVDIQRSAFLTAVPLNANNDEDPGFHDSFEFLYQNTTGKNINTPVLHDQYVTTLDNKVMKFSDISGEMIIKAVYTGGSGHFYEMEYNPDWIISFIPGQAFDIENFEKNKLKDILTPHFNKIERVPWRFRQLLKDNVASLHCFAKVIQRE